MAKGDFTPDHAPPRLGEVNHIALDTSRAKSELGWDSHVGLDDGLRLTFESLTKS
jgi:nucleoside-diphosphate-sugar epimerase